MSYKYTIRKFGKSGCMPCATLTMTFKMARMELDVVDAVLVEYDIEDDPEAIETYGLSSVPVTIVEKDGEEVKRINGMFGVAELIEELREGTL